MKILLFLGLIAAIATIVMTRDSTFGHRVKGDQLLMKKTIIAYPKYHKYMLGKLKYSRTFFRKTITAIYVKDNFRNSSGAEAKFIIGGVGSTFLKMGLHSQYSQGINSTVSVYGK